METSCDDTSVAILETHETAASSQRPSITAQLHFHEKITADNHAYGGIHPIVALNSHQASLATLVNQALRSLPLSQTNTPSKAVLVTDDHGRAELRQKPDFVSVTRGPGMLANLETGVDTAKGLAVAWQVPLLGVNHMQAHALTPRLVAALDAFTTAQAEALESPSAARPEFPFLTMLVSGGHTMLVLSEDVCHHRILASTMDDAIGVVIDKTAREILLEPASAATMFGPRLEAFAFPHGAADYRYSPPQTRGEILETKPTGYSWALTPLLSQSGGGRKVNAMAFSFSGLLSNVLRVLHGTHHQPRAATRLDSAERRTLARETQRVAFEHLGSRVLLALRDRAVVPHPEQLSCLVVAGGVASNQYLRAVLRAMLDARGFAHLPLSFPPPRLCTDNAAMIAWTAVEMWRAGWHTSLAVQPLRRWAIDPAADDGGILGVPGWLKR